MLKLIIRPMPTDEYNNTGYGSQAKSSSLKMSLESNLANQIAANWLGLKLLIYSVA